MQGVRMRAAKDSKPGRCRPCLGTQSSAILRTFRGCPKPFAKQQQIAQMQAQCRAPVMILLGCMLDAARACMHFFATTCAHQHLSTRKIARSAREMRPA